MTQTENTSKKLLFDALATSILKIKSPEKDATGAFKNKYIPLDSLLAAVVIPLATNGITIDATMEFCGEHIFCVTTLRLGDISHSNKILMFAEKSTAQGIASAYTYARRIGLCSLLSIGGSIDDDGEAAEKDCTNAGGEKKAGKKVDFSQVTELKAISKGLDETIAKCFAHYKISDFLDLPQAAFEHTKNAFFKANIEKNKAPKDK